MLVNTFFEPRRVALLDLRNEFIMLFGTSGSTIALLVDWLCICMLKLLTPMRAG